MARRPGTLRMPYPGRAPARVGLKTAGGHPHAREGGVNSRGACEVDCGPFHHTDHHGDFIVVTDAELGMGIVWGAEGGVRPSMNSCTTQASPIGAWPVASP